MWKGPELTPDTTASIDGEFDVLVVGAGVIGSASARALARDGLRVALVDANAPWRGASGVSGGGMRRSAQRAAVRPLAVESGLELRALPDSVQRRIGLRFSGNLRLAESEAELERLEQMAAEDVADGVPAEICDLGRVHEIVPGLEGAAIQGALFGLEDGQCEPRAYVEYLWEDAKARGVTLLSETQVTRLISEDGRVLGAEVADKPIRAAWTVVAAGGGSPRLLSEVGLHLDLRFRRCQGFLTRAIEAQVAPVVTTLRGDLYLRQRRDGRVYACGGVPEFFDRSAEPTPDPTIQGNIRSRVNELFGSPDWAAPSADDSQFAGVTCFPDDAMPVIGPTPETAGLFVATGFYNGVGISMGVGNAVAQGVQEGRLRPELALLAPGRVTRTAAVDAAQVTDSATPLLARTSELNPKPDPVQS
jgi:sarcosine oxidase subunit beta